MRSVVLRRSNIALPLAVALLLGACSAGSSPSSEASAGDPMADCVRVEDGVITISANKMPTANRSLRASSALPITCSGDMYPYFPFRVPA